MKTAARLVPAPLLAALAIAAAGSGAGTLSAQEPGAWGTPGEEPLRFHTFSIAAVDTVTGESGVAVTTRVPCVGNGVPWVRAGVGAVATQAWTRTEYGPELLDLMEEGVPAPEALRRRLEADTMPERRQVGVIGTGMGHAQHTGEGTTAWAGHRSGATYVVQGNLLVGPEVVDAVAEAFAAGGASGRHLADRLIAALEAGQAEGGDARKGRLQSAAMVVADPRPGRSRRLDGVTANINVCEHPTPVAELRRIYDTISRTLGYRTLRRHAGRDVWQLKLILHALGHYRPDLEELTRDAVEDPWLYTSGAVAAVDSFRAAEGLSTPELGSPPGLVDGETVERLWAAAEEAGVAGGLRERIRRLTAVRR